MDTKTRSTSGTGIHYIDQKNQATMERRKIIRRKRFQNAQLSNEKRKRLLTDQYKELLKNPVVKGVAIVGALYGGLFISKYIIREYAKVVVATKKLRDAHRL